MGFTRMFDDQGGPSPRHHFDQDLLDEIEGEALIVIENAERYAALTVEMARRTLEMVDRLRRQPLSQIA